MDSKEIFEAESCIIDQGTTYMTTMALRCAVQLGIPDVISSHEAPITHSELLAQFSIPQEKSTHLYRVMRLLVHNGVFAMQKDEHGQEGYVLTSISKALSTKTQGNFAAAVELFTEPFSIDLCLSMADWFKSSTSLAPFEAAHGMNLYKYFGMHPDINKKFNKAMGSCTELMIKAVLKDLKPMLEGFETLVDVGGGNGAVAKAIVEAAPHLKCTVYDLEHVISDAKADINGITFVAGDMFEFVPSADIIHLKSVLMDWGDEECLKILKRCREAISRKDSGGMVIIVDSVIGARSDSESMKSQSNLDVFVMNAVTGKAERTEMEWKELLLAAGFTSYKITPSFRFHSIIQVYP